MPKKINYNPADRIADLAVVRMQDRIKEIYAEAERDITRKMNEFTQKFEKRDAQYRADVAAGKIAQADYDAWRRGQVFQGEQWKAAKREMTAQIRRANQTAAGIVNGERRAVFQKNANYAAYQIERRTKGAVNFSLYDSATVTRLLKEDKKLLPEYKINEVKDYKWNNSKVNNAVTQSIIQGESFEDLTKRLTHSLEAGNRSTMMTFARTAMTGAQNAGRIEAMHDAEDMGIKVQKRWIATLDSRTRDTHAELDGQVVDVDEPFTVDGMEIMFPGDPNADPALVYNCRCTLGYEYPGVATGIGRRRDNETGEEIEGMTYKEWEKSKQAEQPDNTSEQEEEKDTHAGDPMYDFSDLEQERKDNQLLQQEMADAWAEYKRMGDEVNRLLLGDNSPDTVHKVVETMKKQNEALSKYKEAKEKASVWNSAKLVDTATSKSIEYRVPTKLQKPMTTDEIVAHLGGGDMTEGSCASLGFCYIGQKDGYDVLDFRDGESRDLFSWNCEDIVKGISSEIGKPVLTEATKTGTGGSVKLIKQCVPGKEYYFVCGRHAAIVRATEGDKLEYMELQSKRQNGWKLLGYKGDRKSMDYTFKWRFGCSSSVNGRAYMMDIDDMKESKILKRTYGYMNTAADKQKKGETGHER